MVCNFSFLIHIFHLVTFWHFLNQLTVSEVFFTNDYLSKIWIVEKILRLQIRIQPKKLKTQDNFLKNRNLKTMNWLFCLNGLYTNSI